MLGALLEHGVAIATHMVEFQSKSGESSRGLYCTHETHYFVLAARILNRKRPEQRLFYFLVSRKLRENRRGLGVL